MATHIRLRRDIASQWTSVNPILLEGEAGYETDNRGLKIGNGLSHWQSLPYFVGSGGSVASASFSALSSQVSVLAQAISVISNEVSNLTSAIGAGNSVTSNEVSAVSATAKNATSIVNDRVTSINNFLCALSARSAAASVHGAQSIIDTLSNKISANTSLFQAADAALSTRIDTVSNQASIFSQFRSTFVGGSTGQVLKKNSNTNYDWSWQDDLQGGGGGASGTVTSNEISILSNKISIISSLTSTVDIHASTASLAATSADAHASVASVAATSVDGRVNSVNTFISGLSSRSIGDVSTHGLQSVINALSNRISAVTGNSVTSAEVQTASAAATSADAHAAAASAAATSAVAIGNSVDARVNSINVFISGISSRSVGDVSTHGLQSVVNALSNKISANLSAVVNASTTGSLAAISLMQSAINTVSNQISIISQQVSVLSQAHSALSQQVSVLSSQVSTVSVAVTSVDSRVNTVSNQVSVISQQVSVLSQAHSVLSQQVSVLSSQISTVSVAVTSVDSRVNTVSNQVSAISQFLSALSARSTGNVSTKGLQSVINALSNRIATGSVTVSVTSTELSAASAQAKSAIDVVSNNLSILSDKVVSISAQIVSVETHASTASAAATSVNSRVDSVNSFISGISVRSIGNVSTHGFQSIINAISNRISSTSAAVTSVNDKVSSLSDKVVSISAQLVSIDNHASAASAAATSVLAYVCAVSARTTAATSVKGLQSVINALSSRLSQLGGGGTSVTSNEVSAVSAQAASALSDAMSAGSVVAQNLSLRINSINTFISGISTRSTGTSTHGLQSLFDAVSNTISAVESQVTSVDSRVNSVNSFISGISARSTGNVSTHGLQSVINALSNRISGVVGGSGSVTSNEVSAVSAQAASALSDAMSAGSVVAQNLSLRITSIEVIVGKNNAGVSIDAGMPVVANGVSAGRVLFIKALGTVTNYLNVGLAQNGAASAASISVQFNGPLTLTSGQWASVLSGHPTTGLVAGRNYFVGGSAGTLTSAISGQGTSAVGMVPIGGALTSTTMLLGHTGLNEWMVEQNRYLSVRIDTASNYPNTVSARSVGNVSTKGLQSIVNALSNRISAVTGGSGSVTSTEASIINNGIYNLSNNDAVSLVPGHVVYHGASASTVKLFSTVGGFLPFGVATATVAVSAVAAIQTRGIVALTSAQMKSILNGVSAMTPGDRMFAGASGQWQSTPNRFPIGWAISTRTLRLETTPVPDYQTSLDAVSNQVSINLSAVVNASTNGSLAAISLMQSAINTVSNNDSVHHSAVINASTTGSLAAISLMQSAINTVSNQVSVNFSAVNNASTAGSMAEISNRISADNALSNTISNLTSIVSQLNSVVSQGLSLLSQQISVLSQGLSVVSNQVSINKSALANASTAGSLAAISIFQNISAISVGGTSVKGLQSVVNALSNRLSAVIAGAQSVTSTELSNAISAGALAAADLSARVNSVNTFLSGISSRSAGNVSTHGVQSVIDALSNVMSVNKSAWVNASTVGSIAALSQAISNDGSVTSVLANASTVGSIAALSILSVQIGNGQYKVVTGAQTFSTGTFAKISGLSLSLGANNHYQVEGQLNMNGFCAGSTTAIFQLGMSATNQPVYAALMFTGNNNVEGAVGQVATSIVIQAGGESAICATPSIMYSVRPAVSGMQMMVRINGTIQGNAGAAAVLKVVAATSTTANGGCTVRAGSYIKAFRLG